MTKRTQEIEAAAAAATVDTPQPISKKAKKSVLKVGEALPMLSADMQTDVEGTTIKLSDITKDQGAILFFYPKANTPGCTKQANGFKDNAEAIKKAGYELFGVSADSPKSQTTFKNKFDFPYTLLCDTDCKFLKALGIHKPPKSVIRSHIVIGKGGIVEDIQIKVSPLDSVKLATDFVTTKADGKETEEEVPEEATTTEGDAEAVPDVVAEEALAKKNEEVTESENVATEESKNEEKEEANEEKVEKPVVAEVTEKEEVVDAEK